MSPTLKAYPFLAILKESIKNRVEPIPTLLVPAAPTVRLRSKFLPVSVVAPTPSLETPLTGIFS